MKKREQETKGKKERARNVIDEIVSKEVDEYRGKSIICCSKVWTSEETGKMKLGDSYF